MTMESKKTRKESWATVKNDEIEDGAAQVPRERIHTDPSKAWEPPDGGYGWVIVVCGIFSLILFSTFTQLGVLLIPLQQHFDVSKLVITGINTLHTVGGRLLGIFIGQFLHVFGGKIIMATATLLIAAGYFISSYVKNIALLYFTFGILPSIGCACTINIAFGYSQLYFTKKSSIAAGLVATGFNLGTFIWSPLLNKLIEQYGWQIALRIESAIFLAIGTLITVFLKTPGDREPLFECFTKFNKTTSQNDKKKEMSINAKLCSCTAVRNLCNFKVMHNYIFIVFCVYLFLMGLGFTTDGVYLPVRAKMLGIDSKSAAFQTSVVGIAGTISGPILSAIGNAPGICRYRDVYVAIIMFAFAVTNIASTFTISSTNLLIFAAIMGILNGFPIGSIPVLLADIVGQEFVVLGGGYVTLAFGLCNVMLHPLIGWLLDETNDPQSMFYLASVTFLLAGFTMICVSIMRCRQRRNLYDLERKKKKVPTATLR